MEKAHVSHQLSIQIVEDDINIAQLLAKYVQKEGFKPLLSQTGTEAVVQFDQFQPALVILDLMLPGLTGWQICDHIRAQGDTPILMLTARSREDDRIRGFKHGVDDYVVKPFSPREVMERIKAILRRSIPAKPASLQTGKLMLDLEKYTAYLDDQMIELTTSEFQLLHTLMSRPGRVFSRDELLSSIKAGNTYVVDRVIDVHIGNLRQKIESAPALPEYIMTKRGIGYYFNDVA